jgi:hypothetical protein
MSDDSHSFDQIAHDDQAIRHRINDLRNTGACLAAKTAELAKDHALAEEAVASTFDNLAAQRPAAAGRLRALARRARSRANHEQQQAERWRLQAQRWAKLTQSLDQAALPTTAIHSAEIAGGGEAQV